LDFLVTDITILELDPQFGSPGLSIVITGHNFAAISGSDVVIKFDGTTIETLDTDSNGDISGTLVIPAKSTGNYQVEAEQQTYNIQVSETFRVGTILTILAPQTGPTGTMVTLTGIGFTPSGKWDAYFGDVSIFEDEDVSGDTTLSSFFYIPTVEAGEHTLTVVDLDEGIEIETDFNVTESTSLSFDPESAPVGFNISVEGMYFAESTGGWRSTREPTRLPQMRRGRSRPGGWSPTPSAWEAIPSTPPTTRASSPSSPSRSPPSSSPSHPTSRPTTEGK